MNAVGKSSFIVSGFYLKLNPFYPLLTHTHTTLTHHTGPLAFDAAPDSV